MKITVPFAGIAFALLAFAVAADAPSFLTKAAQGGLTEVAAGELATSKATDPGVREFGTMMVRDHGAANQKVAALAKSKGIPLPETAQRGARSRPCNPCAPSMAPRFDKAYMAEMVKAHEKTLQMLKSEIASGQDADVTKLASGHVADR